ncbi:Ribonuclease BN [subsurface metagenome]
MSNKEDEIVFLGSGGGRIHIRTQYRATGGILFKFNGIQAHIDPGPGAIVRINQYNEDPLKTELFFVTHFHVDHFNDIQVMIEASRDRFFDNERKLVKKGILFAPQNVINYISQYHQNMLEGIIPFKAGDTFNYNGIEIIGTKVVHTKVAGFGIRFRLKDYSIAFSSDTMVFDKFPDQFHGIDILVLNLLRPNSIYCKRHLCTDEVIPYLNKIDPTPNTLIITHFGAYMDSPRSDRNFVPSQVKKLQEQTEIKRVIAAEDGMKLKIFDLLS